MIGAVRRIVLFVAALLFIGALSWGFELKFAEVKYPTESNAQTGNVFRYEVGGGTVYATKGEARFELILHTIEIIVGTIFFLSIASFRLFPNKLVDKQEKESGERLNDPLESNRNA